MKNKKLKQKINLMKIKFKIKKQLKISKHKMYK